MHKKRNEAGDSHDKRNDSFHFWKRNHAIETVEKQKQNWNMKQQETGKLSRQFQNFPFFFIAGFNFVQDE
jgi:hypothetical protein